MKKTVVVVAECREGEPFRGNLELTVPAREIAGLYGLEPHVLAPGAEALEQADELAHKSGLDVTTVAGIGLENYNSEAWLEMLACILSEMEAAVILIPHSTRGMDYAPSLAVRLGAACVTSVDGMTDENGPCFNRAVFGGRVQARIKPDFGTGRPMVVTVEPGAFRFEDQDGPGGEVRERKYDFTPQLTKSLGVKAADREDAGITEADVVVAAGRGVGGQENMALLEKLSGLFPKSSVAGSRPVCDLGWLGYSRQIGLTGATVTPKLYISCGISGARQHTVGMQGSDFIVAISTDPYAAMFGLADVAVVEDLTTFIPVLLEEYEKKYGS